MEIKNWPTEDQIHAAFFTERYWSPLNTWKAAIQWLKSQLQEPAEGELDEYGVKKDNSHEYLIVTGIPTPPQPVKEEGVDLDKLQKKFDDFFEKETPESYNQWQQSKQSPHPVKGVNTDMQGNPITGESLISDDNPSDMYNNPLRDCMKDKQELAWENAHLNKELAALKSSSFSASDMEGFAAYTHSQGWYLEGGYYFDSRETMRTPSQLLTEYLNSQEYKNSSKK